MYKHSSFFGTPGIGKHLQLFDLPKGAYTIAQGAHVRREEPFPPAPGWVLLDCTSFVLDNVPGKLPDVP